MALKYILAQSGAKMGLDPADPGQRVVLLRFVNEAVMELYDQSDGDGMLMEQLFKVDGDKQIALPYNVGPLRAMREYSTHVAWHLTDMHPRYNQFNWQDRWRHWRLKGVSPLCDSIVNEAPLTVHVDDVEDPPLVVTVAGTTDKANHISESFTMTDYDVVGSLRFTAIRSIKRDRIGACNAVVKDAERRTISVVPNNMLEARYRIVDVSLYPWSNTSVGVTDHYMEVLFKTALPWMSGDDDEYPVPGYDNIIVNKVLQLWYEEQGKTDLALAFDAKATRSLARKVNDQNRATEQAVSFVENPHDTLLPSNRPLGPSRYSGQIYY